MKLQKKKLFWITCQLVVLCLTFAVAFANLAVESYYGMSEFRAIINMVICLLLAVAIGITCRNYILQKN